jgi:hypothetical protein
MIAYLGNWHDCPSDEQIDQYTHIVIAFAVSYTWAEAKNICDQACQISRPLTCGNEERPDLIEKWQDMGKKVILSFGGAGMGGSWEGDNNDCWEYCFGREEEVVDQLTDLVTEMNLDGVDLDYEYFFENDQNGSGFTRGEEAQTFLRDVTLGLRNSLPHSAELTHAPMEPDVTPGTGYYNVLKDVADSLDFLMPQYYNGFVRSHSDFDGAISHYTDLTEDLFGGDPTKVVFGFCINDCGNFNLNGDQSKEVMQWLSEIYPCNGGAFFWVVNDDVGGQWSSKVNEQLAIDSGECSSHDDEICEDDDTFRHKNKAKKDCDWVGKQLEKGKDKICDKRTDGIKVSDACPLTCGTCTVTCGDDEDFFYKKEKKDCDWVKKRVEKKGDTEICDKKYDGIVVKDACPVACGICSN